MITNVDLGQASGYIVFALIFAAYFLALEAIFLAFARRNSSRSAVAKRLSVHEQTGARPPTDLVLSPIHI